MLLGDADPRWRLTLARRKRGHVDSRLLLMPQGQSAAAFGS